MLKPIYIVCCELNLEEKSTGLQTYVNVYEKILFRRNPPQPVPTPPTQMRVFAAWIGEQEDIDQEFEFELVVILPGTNAAPTMLNSGKVTCQGEGMIRISTILFGTPPIEHPGIMRFQCRMRRVGQNDWLVQEYPIVFAELPIAETSRAPQPA